MRSDFLPGGRSCVLVVEDDPAIRLMAVDILSDAGFETLEAGDAAQALEALNKSVTRAETVQRFLQQNAGKEFCHKCLAKAVGIKSVHRYIRQLIHNPFFVRRRGRCEACASHRPKLLARNRGKPSPHEQNVISIRGGTAEGQNEKRTGPALSQGPNGHS